MALIACSGLIFAKHKPMIIPSDSKWYSRLVVSDILTKRLGKLDLSFPEVTAEQKAAMDDALHSLENEKD